MSEPRDDVGRADGGGEAGGAVPDGTVPGGVPRQAGTTRQVAAADAEAAQGREIDDAIVALRAEIARLDTEDPDDRARLETLAERLRLRLERSEQGPVDDGAMEVLETLQARYPRVTLLINDITTRLASMGI